MDSRLGFPQSVWIFRIPCASFAAMKTTVIILLVLLVCVPGSSSEPEKKDPIDAAMEKAMDRDPSTAGMVQAIQAAQDKWEKELNVVYAKLKNAMSKEEWTALVASQKAWLDYRDKETKTQQEIYSRMEGTMWVPVSASVSMELVKSRVMVLRGYLDNISGR